MAEDKKDEDFISMLRKMKSDTKKPSAIAETLEKIEEMEKKVQTLEKEKDELKQKVKSLTLKLTLSEPSSTMTQQASQSDSQINRDLLEDLQSNLSKKKAQIQDLDKKLNNLNYKVEELTAENEALKLKQKEADSVEQKRETPPTPPSDSAIMDKALVDNLASELTKKKAQILDFERQIKTINSKVEELSEENEAFRLKLKAAVSVEQKPSVAQKPKIQPSGLPTDSPELIAVSKALVDNLKSELLKKNVQISTLNSKVEKLIKEKESLNEQLIEKMKKSPVDYVIPIQKPTPKEPEPIQASTKTLELLIQDLQTDLNRYKKIVEKLKQENIKLKANQRTGSESKVTETLNTENAKLKEEISKLKKTVEKRTSKPFLDAQNKIKELQENLKEKNKEILELKASSPIEAATPSGGLMSGLIDDLQNRINKLKLVLSEKNKEIEELKSQLS